MSDLARRRQPAVTLRPSLAYYFRVIGGRMSTSFFALLALSVVAKVLAHPEGFIVIMEIVGPLYAVMLGWNMLYIIRSRLVLEDNSLSWRKIVRHGSFSLDEIGSEPAILILDRNGHRLLRVLSVYWSDEAMTQLHEFLNRRFYTV